MKSDTYQRTSLNSNGEFVIEEVKELKYEVKPLLGKATITHLGGNGRFKFILDDIEYTTTFTKHICTNRENYGFNKESDEYFLYVNVEFNVDITTYWRENYSRIESNEYWKSIN